MSATKGNEPTDYKKYYRDVPKSGMSAENLLSTARLKLVMNYPFFGSIAQRIALIENNNIPTTAVDKKGRMYFNRKWVNHFDLNDAVFEMAHEVMHLVQRCFARAPLACNHAIWNKAADWHCDTNMVDAGLKQSKISMEMVTPEIQERTRAHGVIEVTYRYLIEESKNNDSCKACKQAAKDTKKMSEEQDKEQKKEQTKMKGEPSEEGDSSAEGCEGEDSDEGHGHGKPEHTCGNGRGCCVGITADLADCDPVDEQTWTEIIIGAKMGAEAKGNMPEAIGEMINTLTKSKVRWQDYLKTNAARVFGKSRYTYQKRNRRGHAIGIRFPGSTPDSRSAIIVADTSGSMSSESLRQCISESAEIIKLTGCSKVWLILHDMRVYFSGYVTFADLTELKMARGGTSHHEVFDCLERKHKNEEFNVPKEEVISLAIMFTDLGTDFPDSAPSYPVLWAVPVDGHPGMSADVPFGTKVPVEMCSNVL